MPAERDPETRTFFLTEAPVVGFDFSNFPEVEGGATLSAPSVVHVSPATGLTIGSPTVLAADFDDIPSAKGVKCQITPIAAGRFLIACTATMSSGGTRTVRAVVVFK